MSNFKCPHCGMTNIDCGKEGYKTPREIELEEALKKIKVIVNEPCVAESLTDCEHCEGNCEQTSVYFNYETGFCCLYTLTKNKQFDISKFNVVKLKKEKIFLVAVAPVDEPIKQISYKWQDNSITWEATADEFHICILSLL